MLNMSKIARHASHLSSHFLFQLITLRKAPA
jgi:hypothetical protein